jgi:nucleoside phosphorylase
VEQAYTCPHCQIPLEVTPGPVPQDVVCPHCSGLTVIPAAADVDDEATTDVEPSDAATDRDDELSALRIRQLATEKRAAYRSRSYCVIAAIGCVVAMVQLAWYGISTFRASRIAVAGIAYLLVAAFALIGAVYFFRKAMVFDREAKRSVLPETNEEPDFSTLSDGSEQWKKLEDVR